MAKKSLQQCLSSILMSVAAIAVAADGAAAISFSFEENQGTIWDHSLAGGPANSNGWGNPGPNQPGFSEGTATADGLILTVRSTLVGDAAPGNNNLRVTTSGSTQGFVLADQNLTDDENSGTLTNYQRLDFIFSEVVNLTDVRLADIDITSSGTPGFRDAVGAEGFASNVPGAIGSGLDPAFTFFDASASDPTRLIEASIGNVEYAVFDNNTFAQDNLASADVRGQAGVAFGQPVQSFSLYFFNDLNPGGSGNHAVNFANAVVEFEPVPFDLSASGWTTGVVAAGAIALKWRKNRRRAISRR